MSQWQGMNMTVGLTSSFSFALPITHSDSEEAGAVG